MANVVLLARKAARMKLFGRKRKARKPNALYNIDELMPPEGVPLRLEVAGVGVRLGAQLTDILLTLVAAIAFVVLIVMLDIVSPQALTAVGSLLFFAIRIPYYVFSELLWNGQTLGKKLMKIKVVSHDGGSLSAHALVVRNLMKEAEIFLPLTLILTLSVTTPWSSLAALTWIVGTLLVPLLNKRRRRLGDLIAGTYVIHLPVPVLLKDLARVTAQTRGKAESFTFMAHQLDHYGAYELQTLETLMRAHGDRQIHTADQLAVLATVVDKIRHKITYSDAVPAKDHEAFLRSFYNAQRAHLEQRQLFGEKRVDKHHAQTDGNNE